MEILETSLQNKKGVTRYVIGQSIPMLVTSIGNALVEGHSQQFGRTVGRIEYIAAAAVA